MLQVDRLMSERISTLYFTGFSISRSFREAPHVADEIQATLRENLPVNAASKRVWERLWNDDRRAQVSELYQQHGKCSLWQSMNGRTRFSSEALFASRHWLFLPFRAHFMCLAWSFWPALTLKQQRASLPHFSLSPHTTGEAFSPPS